MMQDRDYITIAKAILKSYYEGKRINKELLLKEYPELAKAGAVFITLTQNGRLRGCIGSLSAHRSLIDDIESNTLSAALNDPRFPPLQSDELDKTQVEVSILSEPKEISYSDWDDLRQKIKPFQDGIVLELGAYRATYLPQVWEQLPNFDDFFSSLAQKAGFTGNIFEEHPRISVYHVHKISE